jgi:hypothetical protein
MAVSFATVANGIAAPTPPSGAGEPVGVDSLYLYDFAEDLTLALGRVTASDSALAPGLPVIESQGRDPSMQAGLGDGVLQVLPPQVLNQAINRAILANAGDPTTLLVSVDDSTASLATTASEESPAALFPPVQDVLSQWESRYFNVARADTQSQRKGPEGVVPADKTVSNALHVVVGEVVSEQAVVNAALRLAQTDSDQLGAQTPTGEMRTATDLPIAERVFNGSQQTMDVAASPAWSLVSGATRENTDDPAVEHSINLSVIDSSAGEPATPAKSALVGVKPDLGASNNGDGLSVLGDMPAVLAPHQSLAEQSNTQESVTPLSNSLNRVKPLSAEQSSRLVEPQADSQNELIEMTSVGSAAVAESKLATDEDSQNTLIMESAATSEVTHQVPVMPIVLAGPSGVATRNVADPLLPSSDTAESIAQVGQFVARHTLSGDSGFTVAAASRDVSEIATARPLTEETTSSSVSNSSIALSAVNPKDASRAALLTEPAGETWLDSVRRDDLEAASSVESRAEQAATALDELLALKAAESKSGPMMTSGSVMSGPSLSPAFVSQTLTQVTDSIVTATGVASMQNKGESRSPRQRLDSAANSALGASSVLPSESDVSEAGASIGDISPERQTKDDSTVRSGLGVVPLDRLASAFVGSVADQSDRLDSLESDDGRAVTEVQSTDGEQAALGRIATESSSATGLSSTGGFSDRFSVAVAQSSATVAESKSANSLVNNVSIEVKQLLTSGGGSVRMALTPPEQGTLQLDLVVTDSGTATLEVYGVTEAVRERLESGSTALQRQFEQMGLTLSLSLFDHGKGFDSPNARDSQAMMERSSEIAAESTPRVTKRSGMPVGDDTGRMINLIA